MISSEKLGSVSNRHCTRELSRRAAGLATTLLILACGAPPDAVHAQPAEVRETAAGRDLFERGLELAEQGEWDEAVDRFMRSAEMRKSSAVEFNLAVGLSRIGRLLEATELLREIGADESVAEDVRDRADELLAELLPRLARLAVEVSGDAKDLNVTLDGERLPSALLGVYAPVDPGRHRLGLRRRSDVLERRALVLEEGERKRVVLQPPKVRETSSGSRAWLWTFVGVMVAGSVAAGLGAGLK